MSALADDAPRGFVRMADYLKLQRRCDELEALLEYERTKHIPPLHPIAGGVLQETLPCSPQVDRRRQPMEMGGRVKDRLLSALRRAEGPLTNGELCERANISTGCCAARMFELGEEGLAKRVDGVSGRGNKARWVITAKGAA